MNIRRTIIVGGIAMTLGFLFAMTGLGAINNNTTTEDGRFVIAPGEVRVDGQRLATTGEVAIVSNALYIAITAEVDRATTAEGAIQTNVDLSSNALHIAITTETGRATSAEGVLQTNVDLSSNALHIAITAEVGRANSAETNIQAQINSATNRIAEVEGYTNEAHTAYGWGDWSIYGFLTNEALWISSSNSVVYTNDPALTDARVPLVHDQDWTTITGTPTTVAGYGITDGATGTPLYVESDPIWSGVSNDVTSHASDGETAYGWGNHATNDYATGTPIYVESDPIASSNLTEHVTNTVPHVSASDRTNWDDKATLSDVAGVGYLTNETYLGTITGGTIVTGAAASVTTNGGVLDFVVPSGGGAGNITNTISSDGSVAIANPGGPEPDLSVTATVANAVADYVPLTDPAYQSIETNRLAFQNGSNITWRVDGTNVYPDLDPDIAITSLQITGLSGNGVVPVGAVQMYGGAAAPAGWLLCDGSSVATNTYPALYTAISTNFGSTNAAWFNVPDMRGVFPKGAGTTTRVAGKDATTNAYSAVLGTYYQDKLQGHFHWTYVYANGGTNSVWNHSFTANLNDASQSQTSEKSSGEAKTDSLHGTPRIGASTEPQSLGINFIIKY